MKQLKDKIVAITGAATGIGRSLAIQFAKKGCHLAISDINKEGLEETAKLAKQDKIKITQHLVDVSKKDDVYNYAKEVSQQHGGIHIVINNAGVVVMASVEHISYDNFEWLMRINFWGVVYGTKAFLPFFKQAGEGHIVNMSSIFGIVTFPTLAAYHSAKFAVRGFTECLQQELEIENSPVKASCVLPAAIKTNIVKDSRIGEAGTLNKDIEKAVKNFSHGALTTPDKAASIIIDGIIKGKQRILVGPDAYILDGIQRLLPVRYSVITQKIKKLLKI